MLDIQARVDLVYASSVCKSICDNSDFKMSTVTTFYTPNPSFVGHQQVQLIDCTSLLNSSRRYRHPGVKIWSSLIVHLRLSDSFWMVRDGGFIDFWLVRDGLIVLVQSNILHHSRRFTLLKQFFFVVVVVGGGGW